VTLQIHALGDTAPLARSLPLLTPTFCNRHEGAFNKVFETTGDNIIAIHHRNKFR
jgi:hypothetical protein